MILIKNKSSVILWAVEWKNMKNLLKDPGIHDLISKEDPFIKEVLHDFWMCCVSRQAAILVRREVLDGNAKAGITGGGKEVVQVAMERVFAKGDFRSGYFGDSVMLVAVRG